MLLGKLLEAWKKIGPTLRAIEMPELPWQMAGEGIKKLRGVSSLERILYIRPEIPPTDCSAEWTACHPSKLRETGDALVRGRQWQGGAQWGCGLQTRHRHSHRRWPYSPALLAHSQDPRKD